MTDTHTHRQTDRQTPAILIICPMLCYSNGTDKNDDDDEHSVVCAMHSNAR